MQFQEVNSFVPSTFPILNIQAHICLESSGLSILHACIQCRLHQAPRAWRAHCSKHSHTGVGTDWMSCMEVSINQSSLIKHLKFNSYNFLTTNTSTSNLKVLLENLLVTTSSQQHRHDCMEGFLAKQLTNSTSSSDPTCPECLEKTTSFPVVASRF